jgi:hypothetical protein
VSLLAAALAGTTVSMLARRADGRPMVGLVAASLFLLSAPLWYDLGAAVRRNYLAAAAWGLAALLPFVGRGLAGTRPGKAARLGSAAAFALGLGFKESVAGLPLLLLFLAWRADRRWLPALRAVLPHLAVLGCYAAWRWTMLGGAGGYFFTPSGTGNLVAAPLSLFAAAWGHAWVALLLMGLAWALRPDWIGVWIVGALALAAPFALAAPTAGAGDTSFAGKLVLPYALFLVLFAASLGQLRGRRGAAAMLGLWAALLSLQWQQRTVAERAIGRYFREPPGLEAVLGRSSVVLVSPDYWRYTYLHQLQGEGRAPLLAFMSELDMGLYQPLWGPIAPGAQRFGGAASAVAAARVVSVAGEGCVGAGIDGRGFFRLEVPRTDLGQTRLGVLYRNGPTQWFATLPVWRTRIVMPLTHSDQAIVLLRPASGNGWQARVWKSPFFRSPYPR